MLLLLLSFLTRLLVCCTGRIDKATFQYPLLLIMNRTHFVYFVIQKSVACVSVLLSESRIKIYMIIKRSELNASH